MSLAFRSLNTISGTPVRGVVPTKKKEVAAVKQTPQQQRPANGTTDSKVRQQSQGDVETIKVAVRLKPLSADNDYDEIDPQIGRAWRVIPEDNTIVQESAPAVLTPGLSRYGGGGNGGSYSFDRVYQENSTTSAIYDDLAKNIVESVARKGINGTVFAYGQTSSGKTHTMQGSGGAAGKKGSAVDGIVHMAARDIFACVAEDASRSFAIRVSFLEIYNEDVRDLLVAGDRSGNISHNRTLNVREDSKKGGKGVFVEGLTEHRVTNLETLLHYLNIGEKHKSVAATGMNERSSRSHTIFRVTVESRGTDKENVQSKGDSGGDGVKLVATLNLVDLAGSESVRHTGATGSRQKEGGKINQSLLTLSRVVMGLGQNSKGRGFINFRDSKLTRILQSSLSGNARMAVICCASLSDMYTEETKSTLQFASRAKLVKTRATANEIREDPSVIKQLQREISQRSEEGKTALRQLRALEQSAKEAEKAASDANEKLKRLHDFVRQSPYGCLPTHGDKAPTKPATTRHSIAPPTNKPLGRRRMLKRQFSENLLCTQVDDGVSQKRSESSWVSPRWAGIAFNQSSSEVILLKDALAAKTSKVRQLEEAQTSQSDSERELCDSLRRENEVLQSKVDGLVGEKNDALDWIEELYSQADARDRKITELSDEKDNALAEVKLLRSEVEGFTANADAEKICDELRAAYTLKSENDNIEIERLKREVSTTQEELRAALEEKEHARSKADEVALAKGDADAMAKALSEEKNLLLEGLDDLSVENQQALQIIEEISEEKDNVVSELEMLQAKLDKIQLNNGEKAAIANLEMSSLVSDNTVLTDKVSELESKVGDLCAEVACAKEASDKLNNERSRVAAENETLQAQLRKAQANIIEKEAKLNNECSRMTAENQQALQTVEDSNASLVSKNESLRNQVSQLECRIIDLSAALEVADPQAESGRRDGSCANERLSAECNRMVAENDSLNDAIKQLNLDNVSLKNNAADLEQSVAQSADIIKELSSLLVVAQDEVEQVGQERQANTKTISSMTDQVSGLTSENLMLKEMIDRLERDATKHVSEIQSLQDQVEQLNTALLHQQEELVSSKEEEFLARSNQETQELNAEKDNLLRSNGSLKMQVSQLEDAAASSEQKAKDLSSKLDIARDELDQARIELSVKSTTVSDMKHELSELSKENGQLQKKVGKLMQDIEHLSKEAISKESELKALVTRTDRLSTEKSAAMLSAQNLRRDITSAEMKVKELSAAVEDLTAELLQSSREKSKLESKLNDIAKTERLSTEKADAREKSQSHLKVKELNDTIQILSQELDKSSRDKIILESRVEQLQMLVEEAEAERVKALNAFGSSSSESRVAELETRLDDMMMQMDLLRAGKASVEEASARLLEQKNRALTRLDATLEEKALSVDKFNAKMAKELAQAKAQATEEREALEEEMKKELSMRDAIIEKYAIERGSVGKLAARSIRLVGKQAKHQVEGVKNQVEDALRHNLG